MMWQTVSKAAIIVRNVYQCQKKLKKNWRILLFPQRWWNKLRLIFAVYQVWMNLYFSKLSEAKPIRDKSAPTVRQFLYELICRHGCFAIQINDQSKEFVNEVADELHLMTGTQQRVTSPYHPQNNGLVECQNRTIKKALFKVLDQNPEKWPYVIDGVLFAHRVSRHASTNCHASLNMVIEIGGLPG